MCLAIVGSCVEPELFLHGLVSVWIGSYYTRNLWFGKNFKTESYRIQHYSRRFRFENLVQCLAKVCTELALWSQDKASFHKLREMRILAFLDCHEALQRACKV